MPRIFTPLYNVILYYVSKREEEMRVVSSGLRPSDKARSEPKGKNKKVLSLGKEKCWTVREGQIY